MHILFIDNKLIQTSYIYYQNKNSKNVSEDMFDDINDQIYMDEYSIYILQNFLIQ